MTTFTKIALGLAVLSAAGLVAVNNIISSTNFVPGSQIISGNLFFIPDSNTTNENSFYVKDSKVIGLTASGVNFVTNGSQTGIVLKVDGLRRYYQAYADCTATGGLTTYSTCFLPSPLSTSGSLFSISVECGNVSVQLSADVSFKLTATSASGTVLTSMDNIVMGTGSLERVSFATEQAWNPTNGLAATTLTTVGTVDCKLWATFADTYEG